MRKKRKFGEVSSASVGRKRESLSRNLRNMGRKIGRGNHSEALEEANRLLSSGRLSKEEKSRILAQVGDSEFRRGRFAKAAEIQLQAASQSMDHSSLWLRPYIGQVRALLKIPDVENARMMALHAVSMAESKQDAFDQQVKKASRFVKEGGKLRVPAIPPRVSVVASRMAHLFWREGEPEVAEEFFQKALKANPRGSNKARQGFARLSLANGSHKQAALQAADAIRRGKYRAKTKEAWKILIAARRRGGQWRISDNLIKGLDTVAAPLRANTTHLIVKELRKNNMRQWREVADAWLEKEGNDFPVIATDIKKMMLATAKIEGDAAEQRLAAEEVLQMPGLASVEWLSAAKEVVRAGLFTGQSVNIQPLLVTARSDYGPDFAAKAAHGLALSCMMAKRHDLARPLLQANITDLSHDNPQWGKSVWALARMEALLGNHTAAAELYGQCAETPATPIRFRLQAQLLWCEELISSGDTEAIEAVSGKITALLQGVQDPDVWLDFARQLQIGLKGLNGRARSMFNHGKELALQQYEAAIDPLQAGIILFRLARRQICTFSDFQAVVDFWEQMPDTKRDWLWTEKKHFWEYMGEIFKAYINLGDFAKAEPFALSWLKDPATPVGGLPYIGIPYVDALVHKGRISDALEWCTEITRQTPSHPLCAKAWYWLALEAYAQGKNEKAYDCANSLRAAQGVNIGLLKEWQLDVKAQLILADLEPSRINSQAVNCTPDFLYSNLQNLQNDMKGF